MDSTQFIRRPPVGPMGRIVRIAVIAVTVALVCGSTFNVLMGHRDVSVVFALAAPLGISAWGFARAGYYEAAVVLLSMVLLAVITLTLYLSPTGVHDHAVIAYAGILLFNALLLSRKSFVWMAIATLVSAAAVFVLEFLGLTNSQMGSLTGWTALFTFLLVTGMVGGIGRVVSEILFGSLGDAQQTAIKDPVTGLSNRQRFLVTAAARIRGADSDESGVLVLADLDNFRRMNHVVGHSAADRILVEATRRLAAAFPGALLARMGDDEFALLQTGVAGVAGVAVEEGARDVARRVSSALTFEHAGVSVSAAVGFSIFPRDASGIDSLLMAADSGLTAAKALSTGRISGTA